MSELHVAEFFALLKKSGLLTPQQIEAAQAFAKSQRAVGNASDEFSPAADLIAAELVRQELLTEWQAEQLLKGQTGFILQQYRLLAPVGKGGMGHVFRAHDDRTGAIVAIKVMSRKLTGNQTLVNRFRREIRASSLLNSPHIVKTLDAGRVGNVDFMVMEYVNGDQLDRIMSRITTIPIAVACDIVRQVAIGLQHAHEQKMIHRDIKPANLIVDWSTEGHGTVKIMDMGLVRLGAEGEERTSVTRAGQVMGTPDYMSPEQGWDTATVDYRSDIYSLGCTFFRLLTGRVPFPGDNPLQVLMARCSRDAPSARSLRAEIPEPVNAILKKMTLRDPAGRFQSAQDIIDALAEFSNPLTVKGLRSALIEGGADVAIVPEPAHPSDYSDQHDAGYQQFLREMDSGAAVDLMMSTSSATEQATNTTLPIVTESDRRDSGTKRAASRRDKTARVIFLASSGAIISLSILYYIVNRDSNGGTTKNQPPNKSSIDLPVATLVPAAPVTVQVGQVLKYQPEFDGAEPPSPQSGTLKFQFGKGAPAAASIDSVTGAVEWNVSAEQTPASYDLPIELVHVHSGGTTVVSSTTLVATIDAGLPGYSLPHSEPQRLAPGEPFQLVVKAMPVPDESSGLEYQLGLNQQPGMTIDAKSGLFSWTPTDDDAGRHTVAIELFDPKNSQIVAAGSIALWVLPSISLPTFPEQVARAGEVFQMQLTDRPPKLIGRALQLRIKEGSPPGVVLDVRRGLLSWDVPKEAAGRYEIRLVLEALRPGFEFPPDAKTESLIVVNVATSSVPGSEVPASLIPAEAEVKAAAEALRELFKRDLATSRSVAEKSALSRQMLERAGTQSAGADDFALLDLIAELAEKGRATDVGLEVNRLRAERYRTPELEVATKLATDFRVTSLNAAQADMVIEECLRVAFTAVSQKQYADVAKLLVPPELLLKKADQGTFAKALAVDVLKARELAEELSAPEATVADIKSEELTRLIERWQFAALFPDGNALSYVESDGAGKKLPDNGRSLWKFENNTVRLTASQRDASMGILDPGRDAGRFLLRMQLSAKTTSAMLILGAGREQNLNAHLLTLDNSGFGRIVTVPAGTTVSNAATNATMSVTSWNDVEIFADGPQVRVRLNGLPVVTAQVPGLKPGQLGMLVSLQRSPIPEFELRRPRILLLPDAL